MRVAYTEQLSDLTGELAAMCGLAEVAMQRATQSLLQADLALAEQVIGENDRIDDMRVQCEEKAFALLALQSPVAGDLRIVVSGIHIVADVERMGQLALHVAKIARRRHPAHVLPEDVRGYFAEMGNVAVTQAARTREVLLSRDLEEAAALETGDEPMDDLHKHLFSVIMDDEWPHGVPAAVDVTLLGRFYERFADHAVEVARQVIFLVTGKHPEPPTPALTSPQ
ncbi:MAG: phosphate signaling complex protein PhoU [Mycobacteriaceae bacterium]